MKTLKPGDVVVIEPTLRSPEINYMKRCSGKIGIIQATADNNYWVLFDEYFSLIFHPTSLTKIGTL